MSAAIDLFGAVYTTAGGTRYHANSACYALANGRAYHAWRGGRTDAVTRGTGLYDLTRRSTISAAQFSYTACLRCVDSADALPPLPFATGETYGHEPVTVNPSCCGEDCCGYRTEQTVCGRCSEDVTRRGGARWPLLVPWPCTSAVVLGLVPRCPDCGNGVDVPGGRKCASCEQDDRLDALGTAL
jgi:hypothetical protein